MVDTILYFTCQHAHSAHWIIFLLLLLAGLNVPISEDVLLLIGGAVSSICIPEHTLKMFIWIYIGCWLSAWEAYWIGRHFGPKLYKIRWFQRLISPEKIEKLHSYYEKFGILTFIVGRFIPGGVRNALFMTAGLGKMDFFTFILRDAIALTISATSIFALGFYFGSNYRIIIHYFQAYSFAAMVLLASIVILLLARKYFLNRTLTKK